MNLCKIHTKCSLSHVLDSGKLSSNVSDIYDICGHFGANLVFLVCIQTNVWRLACQNDLIETEIGHFYTLDASREAQTILYLWQKSVALKMVLTLKKTIVNTSLKMPCISKLEARLHCHTAKDKNLFVVSKLNGKTEVDQPSNVGHPNPSPWLGPPMTLTLLISAWNFQVWLLASKNGPKCQHFLLLPPCFCP